MCVELIIHRTHYETREVSIINPRTGLAVYNPFISPGYIYNQVSDRPTAKDFHDSVVTGLCPSHGYFCMMERRFLCYCFDSEADPCRKFTPFHKVIKPSPAHGDISLMGEDGWEAFCIDKSPEQDGEGNTAVQHLRELFFGMGTRLWRINQEYWVNLNSTPAMGGSDRDLQPVLQQWTQGIGWLSNLAQRWATVSDLGYLEPVPGDDLTTGLNKHLQVCQSASPAMEISSRWYENLPKGSKHGFDSNDELNGYGDNSYVIESFKQICPSMAQSMFATLTLEQHQTLHVGLTIVVPDTDDEDDLPDYESPVQWVEPVPDRPAPSMTRSQADAFFGVEYSDRDDRMATTGYESSMGGQHESYSSDEDPDWDGRTSSPSSPSRITRSRLNSLVLRLETENGSESPLPAPNSPPPVLVTMGFCPINWEQEGHRQSSVPASPHTEWAQGVGSESPERTGTWPSEPNLDSSVEIDGAEGMDIDFAVPSGVLSRQPRQSSTLSALPDMSNTTLSLLEREAYGPGGFRTTSSAPSSGMLAPPARGQRSRRRVQNHRASPYDLRPRPGRNIKE